MGRKRNLTTSDFINENRREIYYDDFMHYGEVMYDLQIEEANVRIRVIKKEGGAIPKPCVFVLHNGEVIAAWMEGSTISGGGM